MRKWLIVLIIFLLSIAIVLAEPPKISLVVKPTEGEAPLTVIASEESGDVNIVSWNYDFGDNGKLSTDAKTDYTYTSPGEYQLVLTVMNDKGETAKQEQLVIVKEPITVEPTQIPEIPISTHIIYQGSTSIRDSLASKSPTTSANAVLSTAISSILKDVKYPYDISTSKVDGERTIVTILKIQKFRCDINMEICGYWIEATKNGEEIQVNSPIWISPPPYEVTISEIYDNKTNENIVTIKEDPKLAIEQILQTYIDNQPLGKGTIGTKE